MASRATDARKGRIYGVPDEDTPELTAEVLARAIPFPELLERLGKKPLGRPKAATVKLPVNLRLDPEIVAHFKAEGDGWQTRINAVLSRHVRAAAKRTSTATEHSNPLGDSRPNRSSSDRVRKKA